MAAGRCPPEAPGFSGCCGSELALLTQRENLERGLCGVRTQRREPGNVTGGGGEATAAPTRAPRKASVTAPSNPGVLQEAHLWRTPVLSANEVARRGAGHLQNGSPVIRLESHDTGLVRSGQRGPDAEARRYHEGGRAITRSVVTT